MAMFPRGRRWLVVASWTTVFVALLHTIGNTLSAPPPGEAYATLERTMRDYHLPLGLGMVPSMWDINQSLVFTMSVCLAAMGALGIVAGVSGDAGPVLRRRVAISLTIASAALTLLYLWYQITPAFVSLVVMTLLWVVAVFEAGRPRGPAER
jgi:hypothetical protein